MALQISKLVNSPTLTNGVLSECRDIGLTMSLACTIPGEKKISL